MFDFGRLPRSKQTLVLACVLFWSVLCYLFVSRYGIQGSSVVGWSMAPTLNDGEHFVLSHASLILRSPRRGEIVALRFRADDDGLSIKRVIALPGERVTIRDGRVYVNGRPLPEPYLAPRVWTGEGALGTREYLVPDGCYFVLGDNRSRSVDSRYFGAVPARDIKGVLLLWESMASGPASGGSPDDAPLLLVYDR